MPAPRSHADVKAPSSRAKIKSIEELAALAEQVRRSGRTVALCHGVFDLVHLGHVRHIESASKEADVVIVTVTADRYVNKGPGRPIFPEAIRAEMLAAIGKVDWVGISHAATAELVLEAIRPSVYVKGADYENPDDDITDKIRNERETVEKYGGHLVFTKTVNACNARCPMCTIEEWQRHTPTMKDPLFAKIADDLCAHADQVRRVALYRDGEPLLDKKLAKRVAVLKAGGIRHVNISTNVALLDEKRSRDLLEAGLDMIVLSIDSLKKDVFEAIRLRLDFDEVLENALRFIELRNRIRPRTQIWMRMIRQDSNFEEWPAYEAYWKRRMAPTDRIYYHYIHNWGGQLQGFRPVSRSYEPSLPCVALWSLMVIFGNGDVPLCNIDYNNKFPTGNVRDRTIEELWRSKVMLERRRLHLAGEKACISLCSNCNVWDEPEMKDEFISSEYADSSALLPVG